MKNEDKDLQKGWIYTGDGYKLISGEEFYGVYKNNSIRGEFDAIYKNNSFFIIKQSVNENTMYGSDYYHTRYKNIENAKKFILDNEQKTYSQYQIKHACIHVGIKMDKIEELYCFLSKNAI